MSDEDVFWATKLVLFSVKFLTVSVVMLPAAKSVDSMAKTWNSLICKKKQKDDNPVSLL